MPGEVRADVKQWVRDFGAIRDVEPRQHVALIGDAVATFMPPPDTHATLTLAHEEHLYDVMAGYGGHIEIDVIRAYWSLRSLMEIRWFVSTATARRRRSHRSRC